AFAWPLAPASAPSEKRPTRSVMSADTAVERHAGTDDRRWPIDAGRWPSLNLPHQLFRFRRIRLEDDRALQLAARAGNVFGLDVRASGLQRRAEHGVSLPVGRIAAHRLAKPEDGRLLVLLGPVRISKVEIVVRVVLVQFHCLIEVVRRAAGLRRDRPPNLNHA